MQIIENTTEFEIKGRSAVSIGKFDGVHRGHQELLQRIRMKKEQGLQAVVLTFHPHPAAFFGFSNKKELMTREEKRQIFQDLGVDILIEFPFTKDTAAIPADIFLRDILAGRLHMAYLAAGPDVSFGAAGAGDFAMLQSMQECYGYQVELIDKIRDEGKVISSTAVKAELEAGDLAAVSRMTGRPFRISGKVVYGNQLGRTIGIPTANLLPSEEKLLPPNGVYYSRVWIGENCYPGMSNIGLKPTVSRDTTQLGLETYLYEFSEDIYGKEISVDLLAFRRPEKKFSSLQELQTQMEADLEAGRQFHREAGLETKCQMKNAET